MFIDSAIISSMCAGNATATPFYPVLSNSSTTPTQFYPPDPFYPLPAEADSMDSSLELQDLTSPTWTHGNMDNIFLSSTSAAPAAPAR